MVRWRVNGSQRARRFKTEAEAIAFDEGVSGGTGKAGSPTPNVYPYETSEGTRWRYSFRDSRGRLSTKRGFLRVAGTCSSPTTSVWRDSTPRLGASAGVGSTTR